MSNDHSSEMSQSARICLRLYMVYSGTFTFGTLSDIYGRKRVSLVALSSGFFANLLTGQLQLNRNYMSASGHKPSKKGQIS